MVFAPLHTAGIRPTRLTHSRQRSREEPPLIIISTDPDVRSERLANLSK
jgi:hypothetical protein